MAMYCHAIAWVIIEENHKRDFLQQYRSNLQFCRTHVYVKERRNAGVGQSGVLNVRAEIASSLRSSQ